MVVLIEIYFRYALNIVAGSREVERLFVDRINMQCYAFIDFADSGQFADVLFYGLLPFNENCKLVYNPGMFAAQANEFR